MSARRFPPPWSVEDAFATHESQNDDDDTLVGFLLPMTPDTRTGGIQRSDTRARGDMASDNGLIAGTVPRVIPHPVSTRGAI